MPYSSCCRATTRMLFSRRGRREMLKSNGVARNRTCIFCFLFHVNAWQNTNGSGEKRCKGVRAYHAQRRVLNRQHNSKKPWRNHPKPSRHNVVRGEYATVRKRNQRAGEIKKRKHSAPYRNVALSRQQRNRSHRPVRLPFICLQHSSAESCYVPEGTTAQAGKQE